jgi:hypothetical protein
VERWASLQLTTRDCSAMQICTQEPVALHVDLRKLSSPVHGVCVETTARFAVKRQASQAFQFVRRACLAIITSMSQVC